MSDAENKPSKWDEFIDALDFVARLFSVLLLIILVSPIWIPLFIIASIAEGIGDLRYGKCSGMAFDGRCRHDGLCCGRAVFNK